MEETFAERLRRLREARKLTVGALAARTGLTEAAIRKMEYGDTKARGFINGMKIAEALGVDPAELAYGKKGKRAANAHDRSTETRLHALQEQVAILSEIAKAGVGRLDLTEAQKRQVLARLEKLP